MSGPASVGPARRRRRRLAAGLAALAAGAWLGPGAGVARAVPFCPQWAGFSPANFPQQPHIDNALLPLVPGAQRILDGRSNVNGQPLAHRVTFTVTNLTKVIDGVRTVVVHDVDYSSGQLAESELSFWAQDVFGTVWNIGEYPEEYANGKMEGAPLTWLAGVDGAVPGIHAPWQTPPVGGQRYNQGWSPTIQFLDCAQTIGVGLTRCVPAGCFDGIVATDETSPLDPASGHQRKYYAPGVGIVQIGAINDPQGETLVLTSASQLDADALAAVDAVSLEQDRRGKLSNPVYQTAPPAELPASSPADAGPAPVPTPMPSTPPKGREPPVRLSLKLFPGAGTVTRSGRAVVDVLCATPMNAIVAHPGVCRGRLDVYLRGGRTRIGTARFAVGGGNERMVRVPLVARAVRALHRGARMPVIARARATGANGGSVAAQTSLTLVANPSR